MTEFARNLRRFLEDNVASDMTVEELTGLFFAQHPFPEVNSQADVDREIEAITQLIHQANFEHILFKLGLD